MANAIANDLDVELAIWNDTGEAFVAGEPLHFSYRMANRAADTVGPLDVRITVSDGQEFSDTLEGLDANGDWTGWRDVVSHGTSWGAFVVDLEAKDATGVVVARTSAEIEVFYPPTINGWPRLDRVVVDGVDLEPQASPILVGSQVRADFTIDNTATNEGADVTLQVELGGSIFTTTARVDPGVAVHVPLTFIVPALQDALHPISAATIFLDRTGQQHVHRSELPGFWIKPAVAGVTAARNVQVMVLLRDTVPFSPEVLRRDNWLFPPDIFRCKLTYTLADGSKSQYEAEIDDNGVATFRGIAIPSEAPLQIDVLGRGGRCIATGGSRFVAGADDAMTILRAILVYEERRITASSDFTLELGTSVAVEAGGGDYAPIKVTGTASRSMSTTVSKGEELVIFAPTGGLRTIGEDGTELSIQGL